MRMSLELSSLTGKSVEPIQKHVNKCEQNAIILWKLWRTTISFWARRNLRRGIKMAEILTLKSNYNPRQSKERAHVMSDHLSLLLPAFKSHFRCSRQPSSKLDYFPISMISGIFRHYYYGIFGYCSKHYIFKKYFLRVNCLFNCVQFIKVPQHTPTIMMNYAWYCRYK